MRRTIALMQGHPLTEGRLLGASLRYLRWQVASRLRREIEVDWIDGAKLVVRSGMTGATGNIYCGLHEFADMGFVLHFLQPGDLFVDAGANVGSYTVLASRVCGARTLAIEPVAATVAALRRNVAANRIEPLVRVESVVLGASEGSVGFTIDADTTNAVAGPGCASAAATLPMRPLDALLAGETPALLKLDVEGYEAEVLSGARRTLADPGLLAVEAETTDRDVERLLAGAGFARWHYDPLTRHLDRKPNGPAASNALFLRDVEACRARLRAAPRRTILGRAV
jgi:FkbM family methyltransferase